MPDTHPLAAYLRARRELVRPEDVGLGSGPGLRRVPGLRRSEVAVLAGISTEYYVKLEQGQVANPTAQVLGALSRALQLDATATSYLHSLARLTDRPTAPVQPAALERARWLIDSWPMTAGMILDPYNDIVAVNPLMSALIPGYKPGLNSLFVLLTDLALRELYLEWEGLTMRSIGLLRSQAGLDPQNPQAKQLIAQLTEHSPRFRELWGRHDITGMTEGTHPMAHPEVGALSLHYAHLPLSSLEDHRLFLYFAEPGSPSEAALGRLSVL